MNLVGAALATAMLAAALPAWAQSSDADGCVHETDPGQRIGFCTRAVQSGEWSGADLAWAFNNRGIAYRMSGLLDRAIADFDTALRLDPDLAPAFHGRGNAYRDKGRYDRAILDYDAAIDADPDHAYAYSDRGNAYRVIGQYERAIEDFDAAIDLDPDFAAALENRGLARFYLGSFPEAASDFERVAELDPSNLYTLLWLTLTRARAGVFLEADKSELAEQARSLDLSMWPGPVLRMYLGEIDAPEMYGAAKESEPARQNERVCQAYFYQGEVKLLRQDVARARELLRSALDGCPVNSAEHQGAKADLARLGE